MYTRVIPLPRRDLTAIAAILAMPALGLMDVNIIAAAFYKRLAVREYDISAQHTLFGAHVSFTFSDEHRRFLRNLILRSFEIANPDWQERMLEKYKDYRDEYDGTVIDIRALLRASRATYYVSLSHYTKDTIDVAVDIAIFDTIGYKYLSCESHVGLPLLEY